MNRICSLEDFVLVFVSYISFGDNFFWSTCSPVRGEKLMFFYGFSSFEVRCYDLNDSIISVRFS